MSADVKRGETMLKKIDLQLLADGGENSATEPKGNQAENKTEAVAVELTPEVLDKIDKIANERSSRAANAALKSYFQQQGLSEEQAAEAIGKYKAEKAKEVPEETQKLINQAKSDAEKQLTKAKRLIAVAELKSKPDINYKLAERLIDWDSVTVDDDGNVKGIDEALKKLETEFPEVKRVNNQPGANPPKDTKTQKDRLIEQYNEAEKRKDWVAVFAIERQIKELKK